MVTTFEIIDQQPIKQGESPDMNAASALLPPGAYTTFRTYGNDRILRLSQHLRRLEESAALQGLHGRLVDDTARSVLCQVLKLTGNLESRIRLTFAPPRFFVSIEPFIPYPMPYYEGGVWCVTVNAHRNNPHAKSTSFIAFAGGAYRALPSGAHEGLMISDDGMLLEGLSSNFFALLDGVLYTEQERALVGVTQSLVLEVASDVAREVEQSTSAIRLTDLVRVEECFITSVSREIMPVVKIDTETIGTGLPGPFTRRLMQGLSALIAREARSVCG